MDARPLVTIVGPTASGKTALSLELAKRVGGEIICADSRTVYVGMDIGTAKPSEQDMLEVEHYGVNITTPDKPFTAAQFQSYAYDAINTIVQHGHIPIMVGGTGLYIDSILFDYRFGDRADLSKRAELESLSIESLIAICSENGYELPINVKNKRHLIRTIELGGINRSRAKTLRPNTIVVGLQPDKEKLRVRIAKRAAQMLDNGLIDEAQRLASLYGWESEAMTGNVYPIMRRLIDGEISEQTAQEMMVESDMKLVKKQLTWFRRHSFIHWSSDLDELAGIVEQFLDTKPTYN